ncbi:DUF3043 domain-containing protein [Kineococcus glutinatus]|uniref:DUF3043 domain-containing protein n=1 Tax=Kineococcus glutinatus TaxID=1070872 RepID=A0ABP9I2J8_9ACTN
MFGRAKEKTRPQQPGGTAGAPTPGPVPAKPGGKGRPTPSRSEAQARNRRPLVPADRKAARTAARQALREERARMQQALLTGDERHLPARDRGPRKRLARDVVDARHNLGEWFLVVALISLVLSSVTQAFGSLVLVWATTGLIYLMLAAVVVDSVLLSRRIKRAEVERFGDAERGVASYGVMRALQVRRLRRPVPQVKRGEQPR